MRPVVQRLCIVAVVIVVAACSASTPPATSSPAATPGPPTGVVRPSTADPATPAPDVVSGPPSEAAIAAYGYGPSPDHAAVLQPDVVVIGGGANAIRGVSEDGTTWAIDPRAPGAADLREGDVLFATSRAVGRVVAVRDAGDDRVVTLAPVLFGEVVKEAQIDLSHELDPETMWVQELPVLPGTIRDPGAEDTVPTPSEPTGLQHAGPADDPVVEPDVIVLTTPTVRLASLRGLFAATNPSSPPVIKGCREVGVGDWGVKPCLESGKVTLTAEYKGAKGLKVGATLVLRSDGLKVNTHSAVSGGFLSTPTMTLEGINGFEITLLGGAARGAKDNVRIRVEVPIEDDWPIPPSPATGGLPLNVVNEFKFIVETAFSGNNSTLEATGSYDLEGPIGIQDGKPVTPKLSKVRSLFEGITGIPVGASGMVFAVREKVHVGVGIKGFVAGPYVTMTVSAGVSKGSALGAPLATCQSATLKVDGGIGAGITASFGKLAEFLPSKVLEKLKPKVKGENDVTWTIFNATRTEPDVPLCRG